MIPSPFLRKMGIYNLNFDGVAVQAKVVDNEQLVDTVVAELRSRLDSSFPIVGFDLKPTEIPSQKYSRPELLLLYVRDLCMIVQLGRMQSVPSSLSSFLSDQSICFLGVKTTQKRGALERDLVPTPRNGYKHSNENRPTFNTAVDIGTFAARVLKDRALEECTDVEELAIRSGSHTERQRHRPASEPQAREDPRNAFRLEDHEAKAFQSPESEPPWAALCFSNEEVQYAMHEARMCFTIGTRLMSTLD